MRYYCPESFPVLMTKWRYLRSRSHEATPRRSPFLTHEEQKRELKHSRKRGLVLQLPRSKTNQRGDTYELVVLPRATNPARCPRHHPADLAAARRYYRRSGVPGRPWK